MSASNDQHVRVELGKIVLTEHLDVRLHRVTLYGQYQDKIWVHVDDEPIMTCMHVVCSAPEDEFSELNSVDELIQNHKVADDAIHVEPETLLQLHASSLQAWVEHGYDSALIDSRIAHPVLMALARAGDKKAIEKYLESVLDRWQQGNMSSRSALFLYNFSELVVLNKRGAINKREFLDVGAIRSGCILHLEDDDFFLPGWNDGLYAVLQQWEDAGIESKVKLARNKISQLRYLNDFGLIDDDDLFIAGDPRSFYRGRGGSATIESFVFSLLRPIDDPPGYASFSSTTMQLIEDHGGFDSLRAAWASVKCGSLPWLAFLQSIIEIDGYRFKGSKYIYSSVRVYLRSALVSPSQYIVLMDDGWHVIGREWMTEEEYTKLVEERQEAERQRKIAANERRIAARALKKKKTRSTTKRSVQDASSTTKLEDFTR